MNKSYSNYKLLSSVAKFGLKKGIVLTYAYTLIFVLYAVVRSSSTILSQLHREENLFSTLFANAFSITISSLSIATLIAIFSALLGIFTALVIFQILKGFRRFDISFTNATLIGFVTCLIINLSLQAILFSITGFSWFISSTAAYLFWIGIPSVVYILECSSWAIRLKNQKN